MCDNARPPDCLTLMRLFLLTTNCNFATLQQDLTACVRIKNTYLKKGASQTGERVMPEQAMHVMGHQPDPRISCQKDPNGRCTICGQMFKADNATCPHGHTVHEKYAPSRGETE